MSWLTKAINPIKSSLKAGKAEWASAMRGRSLDSVILNTARSNMRASGIAAWGGTAAGAAAGYAASDDHPVLGTIGGGLLGNAAGVAGYQGYRHMGALKGVGRAAWKGLRG